MKHKSLPSDLVDLSNRAWRSILSGDVSTGIDNYNELLSTKPNLGDYMNRGIGRLLMSDFEGAEEDFRLANDVNPSFRVMNLFVGVALCMQGKCERAAESWYEEIQANRTGRITNADEGGARAPLLLWSYAVKNGNAYYLDQSETEMHRLLPQNEGSWIQSIILYALEEIAETDVRDLVKMRSSGVNSRRRMLIAEYYLNLSSSPVSKGSIAQRFYETRASISDPEHHLMKYELSVGS